MIHPVESSQHWVVHCLGCKNPIVLCVETTTGSEEAKVSRWKERGFLRAWCTNCCREYPYRSTHIECLSGLPSEPKATFFFSADRKNLLARSAKA